ncbi:ArsR family transcriptional regulator (modular protein) [Candidatus Zixiibacteriota bacterium]|nr:ArsR family transcriptional regulator (modular protein) [candidate division Zixibacteria bacterium]
MKEKNDITLPPVLRAMADTTRLKILLMLESKGRTVGEIVSFFNLSQPTITRHLQTLMAAGLVRRTRKGQHVCYELNTESLRSTCVSMVACFPCCGIDLKAKGAGAVCEIVVKKKKSGPGQKSSPGGHLPHKKPKKGVKK